MAKTIATIVIMLAGGYVVGGVAWAVFSVLWEDFGETIKARWPRWVVVVFPLLFTVYITVLKAFTLRQMRRAAEDYDAAHPGRSGRESVWPRPRTTVGRASVPSSRVIDGEWAEHR